MDSYSFKKNEERKCQGEGTKRYVLEVDVITRCNVIVLVSCILMYLKILFKIHRNFSNWNLFNKLAYFILFHFKKKIYLFISFYWFISVYFFLS